MDVKVQTYRGFILEHRFSRIWAVFEWKVFKGVTFLILEFLINIQSNLNTIIISSFKGQIENAVGQTNFQWLMFYPCVYLFAMWDAYRDAGGGTEPYAFLPFVLAVYLGTVGVVYSDTIYLFERKWGPVWLSILFLLIGVVIGFLIKTIIQRKLSG